MGFLDAIWSVFNYQVPINVAPLYSARYAASNTVPFWLLVASFAILFSVVWIASSYINIFKDKKNKGPRSMFAIAVAFISLFGTPLAIWIMKVVYTFTLLTIIAVLVLGSYIIWTLFRSGWAESAKTNGESSATIAEANKKNAATSRQNEQTTAYKEATKGAVSKGMSYQLGEIRRLKISMKRLLSDFSSIKKKNTYPVANNVLSKMYGDISKVNENIGKIISFNTENDRVMSLMSTKNYDETNAGSLTSVNPTTNVASLKVTIDKETNDLGHSIGAIKEVVQKGIPDADAINNLINWSEASINIATRMERDIVLEKQMVEKLS